MSIYNLDKIFRPASVAVVGADEREGSIGRALMSNLKLGGYKGEIFPVNPEYRMLDGLRVYPSVGEIGKVVDLVLIATPIETVSSTVGECVQAGVGGVAILSAGGREIGPSGRQAEEKIRQAAARSCIRIVGPNCWGVISSEMSLNASFAGHMPLPGKMAFVSQSGALCNVILDLSLKERIGFSHFVNVGSMLDVDFGDLINYLGDDGDVGSILIYMESLSNFRKFMSAARAVSRIKPIIVLKSGRSPAGVVAASSHIGALIGEDAVYDAAFKRAGIVRVNTVEELFDCAELAAKQPRPAGPGLAVITNAGGPGVMAVDAIAFHGMELASLSSETIHKLNEVLPASWSHGNPVDILGDAAQDRYCRAVEICMTAPEVNSLLIIMAPQPMTDSTIVARCLSEILKQKRVSVFAVWMGAEETRKGREILNNAGIPTYEAPERAVAAFTYMHSYARNLEMLQQIPPKLAHDLDFDQPLAWDIIESSLARENRALTEVESKALLDAYGIPVNPTRTALSADEAVRIAREMGYPVAMKILSRDIPHKSDVRGVMLDVKNDEDVRNSFHQLVENAAAYHPSAGIEGVTVQPMLTCPDYELILGAKLDADFGPVLLFGMGGIMTEVLEDRAIALPPLNRHLARRLIESTHVYELLKGYRGHPPVNLILLEEILIRLSQLVTDFPEITDLDINPMIVADGRITAADARVVVKPSGIPSPLHLVISPYPGQYERKMILKEQLDILLRPIKPEDAPLLIDLFNSLSPSSIYFRFFRPLKSLSHRMLARFTQIDYDRDIVLVAVEQTVNGERILGVARFMGDPDATRAEFAIVVGDPWQGLGVGVALLEHCISIARERGLAFIWGMVLPENTSMIGLGRKLGFNVSRSLESADYELRIDLKPREEGETCPLVF